MNVPSATPPVAGSAVNGATAAGPGVATSLPDASGIADLFSALLASLQASLTNAPVISVADGAPAAGESADSQAPLEVGATDTDVGLITESDVETPPESNVEATATAGVYASLAGSAVAVSIAVPKASSNILPAVPETAAEVVGEASDPEAVSGRPVQEAGPQQTGPQAKDVSPVSQKAVPLVPGVSPAPQEAAPQLAAIVAPAEPDAEAESTVQPNAGKPVPPLVPRGQGAFVAEAVRQGQLQASQVETGSGRTIRRLVQDAIQTARARAESADVAVDNEADAGVALEQGARDGADAPLFLKRSGLDMIPELRPGSSPATGASPNTQTVAAGLAAGLAAGDAPGSGEVTQHARDTARAALPQSVDVRDVGDFTVRSVRYLSGRTEETVTVRLVPRSLGELHLTVRSAADGLEIVLTVANHAARERLEGQIVGLREMLTREGVDVSRVTVQAPPSFDLGSQLPSQHQHHQNHAGHASRHHAPAYREPEHNPPEQQFAGSGRPQHDGGLNMLA